MDRSIALSQLNEETRAQKWSQTFSICALGENCSEDFSSARRKLPVCTLPARLKKDTLWEQFRPSYFLKHAQEKQSSCLISSGFKLDFKTCISLCVCVYTRATGCLSSLTVLILICNSGDAKLILPPAENLALHTGEFVFIICSSWRWVLMRVNGSRRKR